MKLPQLFLLVVVSVYTSVVAAQPPTTAGIFSHNDYKSNDPFYGAYNLGVGYIEADVYLQNGKLLVAHEPSELDSSRTLERLYLKPIGEKIAFNKGNAYGDASKSLTLMIDLKTEGTATLNAIVSALQRFPSLTTCQTLYVTISGNMPAPTQWANYPSYINFDGRPGIAYTPGQLKRVRLISTGFYSVSKWNGKNIIVQDDRDRIKTIVDDAHAKGKPVRFWATPDFKNAWVKLLHQNVDIINTDRPAEAAAFVNGYAKNTYHNTTPHAVYKPLYNTKRWKNTPTNVILIIGDGTGLAQWYSGYTANQGQLNTFQLTDVGLSITTSADSYITDSAAGATAMATGEKTNNRFIGVDASGKPLKTIAEQCKQKSYNVALISNGDITDATPASFYAHQNERSKSEPIAADFLNSGVDILIGGGEKSFVQRSDGRNLFAELQKKHYTVSTSFAALDTIKAHRFVVLEDNAVVSKLKGRQDFLSRSLNLSLRHLSAEKRPFFVMMEGAQVDWGGHDNNMPYLATELLDLDQAIGEALKFADQNNETLIIITADHETGGVSLLDGSIADGTVHGNFSTNDHTGIAVPVFAYGPGAALFRGVYQNTEIAAKIRQLLALAR